jgi:hypothetical protein
MLEGDKAAPLDWSRKVHPLRDYGYVDWSMVSIDPAPSGN